MILYTDREKHNFLSEYWCNELLKAGINMDDASYVLATHDGTTYVCPKEELNLVGGINSQSWQITPTYTLAELIYKFNEYPFAGDDNDSKTWGPIGFIKDAPFYVWTYYPENDERNNGIYPQYNGKNYIECYAETPIEAAAKMLLVCKDVGINIVTISGKYETTKMK